VSILVNIVTVSVGLGMIAVVLRLIVKKHMSETQAILWVLIGLAAVVLGIFPNLIPWIAGALGIWYAPSILLIAATIGLLLIQFSSSIVLSEQVDKTHELAMQIALLRDENEALKKKIEEMERDFH